jgi:hypothetical protein
MRSRTIGLALILVALIAKSVSASDCSIPSATKSFSHMDRSVSLPSPDARWQFLSTGTGSPDEDALLQLVNSKTHRSWHFGQLGRNGTAFWSQDSKWLILIDEYAADDTKIRLFDLNLSSPREVHGLDARVKHHVLNHVPSRHSTLWITYPKVCFISGDSSRISRTVDAPFVPNVGGSGTGMKVDLSIQMATGKISEIAVHRD